ncbi:hypothetical protein BGZ94_009020 [Podila epigama]|nr:hypothetical protein BGZ94_009020 [Podila epigama]
MTSTTSRPVGDLERYYLEQCNVGHYTNVVVGVRLQYQQLPGQNTTDGTELSLPRTKEQWLNLLTPVITPLVQKRPMMTVVIAEHLSPTSSFQVLPSIDLAKVVQVESIQTPNDITAFLEEVHRHPFDLTDHSVPLWKILIVHVKSDDTFYLLYCLHHSIGDGRSATSFSEELVMELNRLQKSASLSITTTPATQNAASPWIIPINPATPLPLAMEEKADCSPSLVSLVTTIVTSLLPYAVKKALKPKYWAGEVASSKESPKATHVGFLVFSKEETQQIIEAAKAQKATVNSVLFTASMFAVKSVFLSDHTDKSRLVTTQDAFRTSTIVCPRAKLDIRRDEHFPCITEFTTSGHKVELETGFWEMTRDFGDRIVAATGTAESFRRLLDAVGLLAYLKKSTSGWSEFVQSMYTGLHNGREGTIRGSNIGRAWDQSGGDGDKAGEVAFRVLHPLFSQGAFACGPVFTFNIATANGVLAISNIWQRTAFTTREKADAVLPELRRIVLEATRPFTMSSLASEVGQNNEKMGQLEYRFRDALQTALFMNYTIIRPFWTPLFWAAALSVPLHALKVILLSKATKMLEKDLSVIVLTMIGGAVSFVLEVFLGRPVVKVLSALFNAYCHIIYVASDNRSKNDEADPRPKGTCTLGPDCDHYEQFLDYRKPDPAIEDFYFPITGDELYELHPEYFEQPEDYQLHPNYQTLLEHAPDQHPRRSSGPSYVNLIRLALIFVVLRTYTPQEIWMLAKTAVTTVTLGSLWDPRILQLLLIAVALHIIYSSLQLFFVTIETAMYPDYTMYERRRNSVLRLPTRVFANAVQRSLNSTLSTIIVLSTIFIIGVLMTILSAGVVHDVQGIVGQTHQRVTKVKEYQQAQGRHGSATLSTSSIVNQMDDGLVNIYDAGLAWFDPILKDTFDGLYWGATDWATHISHVFVEYEEPNAPVEPMCEIPRLCQQQVLSRPKYRRPASHNTTEESDDVELFVLPSLASLYNVLTRVPTLGSLKPYPMTTKQRAINLTQMKFLLGNLFGYTRSSKMVDNSTMLWGFNIFNDLLFRGILFILALTTFTSLRVSPLQRIGWLIDQALASRSSMGSFWLSSSPSPGRGLATNLEFAITGTFLAMFKLSIYHTIFTLVWTHTLADRVMADLGVSDFVPVKYAWLTAGFGIALTLFPIAPNWLVSLPGAIVHFYVYGGRHIEALCMVLGHLVFSTLVDGAIWDSHVVKTAQPGVSSAFWLGLWIFLGGSEWGVKGLLVGPVMFACIPAIWAAVLELRGRPSTS